MFTVVIGRVTFISVYLRVEGKQAITVLRTLLKKKEKIQMTNGGKQEHRLADFSERVVVDGRAT